MNRVFRFNSTRSTIFYAPALFVPRIASFVVIVVLTRRMSTSDFGLYALTITVGELVDAIGPGWVRITLLRLDSSRQSSLRSAMHRSLVLASVGTGIAILAITVIALIIARDVWFEFTIACSVYVAANNTLRIYLVVLQAQSRSALYGTVESIRGCLMIVVVILVLNILSNSFLMVSTAISASTVMCIALAYVMVHRTLPKNGDQSVGYHERVKFGMPIIAAGLVSQLATATDRIMLQTLASPAHVGVYAAVYALGRQPVDMAANVLNMGKFPELVKEFDTIDARAAGETLAKMFLVLAIFGAVSIVAALVLSPYVVRFVLPKPYYADGIVILPLVVTATVIMNVRSFVFDNIFHLKRQNWVQVLTHTPGVAVTIVLNMVLVPSHGAIGAALAMCSGMTVGLVMAIIATRRYQVLRLSDIVRGFSKRRT